MLDSPYKTLKELADCGRIRFELQLNEKSKNGALTENACTLNYSLVSEANKRLTGAELRYESVYKTNQCNLSYWARL